MSDMKLILESWRGYVEEQKLEELSGSDPITYGQLKSLLNLFAKAKAGLGGEALAQASGITDFFSSDEGKALVDIARSLTEQNESDEGILNEDPLTIGAVYGAYKLGKAAIPVAANLFKFGQKLVKKLKDLPTEETDKVPFLDLFNMDPKYAEIIDDRIEERFLKDWIASIADKPDDDVVEMEDLDVNLQLQRFLKDEFERTLAGHTSAGAGPQTADDVKAAEKALKKKRRQNIRKQVVGV